MTSIPEPKVFRGPCDAAIGRIVHGIEENGRCRFAVVEPETEAAEHCDEEGVVF